MKKVICPRCRKEIYDELDREYLSKVGFCLSCDENIHEAFRNISRGMDELLKEVL